jgi:microcompartment protein CcmL/EutN
MDTSQGKAMQGKAIGLVELSSVAAGFLATDSVLKAAEVRLLLNRTICSGKYIVLVGGDVADVEAAVDAGRQAAGASLIDSLLLPNVSSEIFPAISGSVILRSHDALGIIEAFSVASLLEGADAAVKTADVQLFEVRLAMALGGKAFARLVGSVADVTAAVEAGADVIARKGLLVNKVVIPSPVDEVYGESV